MDLSSDARRAYYRELAADYGTSIRQLVPRYDEILELMAGLVGLGDPASLLDIGCGTGELTHRLADAVPRARVTAVEVSAGMAAVARTRLEPLGDRVRVVERDVLDVPPEAHHLPGEPFDVVHSNLVLHNLPEPQKRRALEVSHGLLAPGGAFVWGDLIRFADPRLQSARVERRIRHARETGCPEALIEWNFRKEAEEDFPLTSGETLDLCRKVGFPHPEVAWAGDTFLVVWARKGPARSRLPGGRGSTRFR
jgi:tRNA (cmo5U34)-methyltransferase